MSDVKASIAAFAQQSPELAILRGEEAQEAPKEPLDNSDEQVSESVPADSAEETQDGSGESPQAEQDDGQEDAKEPLHTVVVDGKSESVPLSELIAGYQRGADYSKKTREVAENRKQVENQKAEIGNLQKTYAERLTMLEAALKPQVPTPEQLNRALQAGDTASYLKMQNQLMQYNAVMAERQGVEATMAKQHEAELRTRLETEQKALVERLPEYGKQEAHQKLRSFLLNQGMSEDEVNTLSDHRAVIIADMAMKYGELMAKSPDVKKRVENLPKLAQKVTSPSKGAVDLNGKMQALETLEKTGKFADTKQRMAILGQFLQ